jgi:hypothetical protein
MRASRSLARCPASAPAGAARAGQDKVMATAAAMAVDRYGYFMMIPYGCGRSYHRWFGPLTAAMAVVINDVGVGIFCNSDTVLL